MQIQQVTFGSPFYERTKRFREEILRHPLGLMLSTQDVEGEEAQFHIAALEPGGMVRGTVLLKPLSRDTVKLRQMAVAPELQGRGMGRKLGAFAERMASEKGFITIELHARLTALGFYEKLGYRAEGEAFIEVTVATIKMTKRL